MKLYTLMSSVLVAAALAVPAQADDWTLDANSSSLHFVSVKNDVVAETHRFTELQGQLNDGALEISIPVSSIDTAIPIRNERMLKHLFNAAEFELVTATAQVPSELYETDTATGTFPAIIPLTVFIAGETVELEAAVQITKIGPDRVLATTSQPLLINAQQFKLIDGINQLQEIAGLKAIDHVVPVTFSVQFERD
ncbi:hypothetical protein IDAT_02350 [Pseudidiomarina atlantica]|uniref:Lipid/polyisoprenoid-binding YceI-like domain-containing protein n=1 Tax=Pseudidiomarina atlantica TaxID=1517416 RepID=A0A094L5H3_9GAMM|nr:YceI family protein [Pseudidiomarina atlantica]KFZ29948.1 hypothetical protein IDAT_02350 [Pseudidiomarina atlantica]